jgi:hypothetical protein
LAPCILIWIPIEVNSRIQIHIGFNADPLHCFCESVRYPKLDPIQVFTLKWKLCVEKNSYKPYST